MQTNTATATATVPSLPASQDERETSVTENTSYALLKGQIQLDRRA